jgi:hypothetical protein
MTTPSHQRIRNGDKSTTAADTTAMNLFFDQSAANEAAAGIEVRIVQETINDKASCMG